MKKVWKEIMVVLLLTVFLGIMGCGEKVGGGRKTMEIPELGVFMTIPSGWILDNSGMCHKGDYTGILASEEFGNKTLEQFVNATSVEFGSKLVSKESLNINGVNAIQAVIETPSAGSKTLRVYLPVGTKVVYASFTTLIGDYPGYEASLLKADSSIKVSR